MSDVIPIGKEIKRVLELARDADWNGNVNKADLLYEQARVLMKQQEFGVDWYVRF